jgi:HEAT repeat protein
MTYEMRPMVAAMLSGEHRAEREGTGELGSADIGELREIAGGTVHPEYRLKAMALLAETAVEPDLFRAALQDDTADDTVRAAGATWLSRSTAPDAEAVLLSALANETTTSVRHKIVAGLARVGGEDALPALSDLAGSDQNLAAHAAFAQSVVAYRAGIAGYELPVESEPLPAQDDAPASQTLETYETIPDGSHLLGDTYGLIVGPSVAGLRCGGRQLAVAIDLTALARLLTTPTLAALIASKAESDGSPHTSMLVLCSPAGYNTARVAIHRTSGTPVFTGSAQVSGMSVSFQLTAFRAPGARRTTITGTISSGVLEDLKISAGEVSKLRMIGDAT